MNPKEIQVALFAGLAAAAIAFYFFTTAPRASSRIIYMDATAFDPVKNPIKEYNEADIPKSEPQGPGTNNPKPGDCFTSIDAYNVSHTVCFNPDAKQ